MNLKTIQKQKPISELIKFSIINIDKPTEHTSFDVVARIRDIFHTKKVGHFGTLDPKVTGVLPISLNRACKLSDFFMHHDKEYIGKMYVHKEVNKKKLEKEMKKFIGKILQKPPVKSSVKRVERERTIRKFKILKIYGKTVSFHADVEAGTYIRKLISDLGERIGGAHMIELRRIRAGIFLEKNSYTIEEVSDAVRLWKEKKDESKLRKILIPAEIIGKVYPEVQVKKKSLKSLLNGKPLMKSDIEKKLPNSEIFSVFYKKQLVGMYHKIASSKSEDKKGSEQSSESAAEKLIIIAKPKFVLS